MLDNFFAGISDSWVISWFFGHHNFRRSPAAAKAVLWGLFWVVFLWSGGLHLVDSSFLISKFYFCFLLRHNFSKFIFKIYFWFWVSFFYFSFLFLNFYFCVCVSFFIFLILFLLYFSSGCLTLFCSIFGSVFPSDFLGFILTPIFWPYFGLVLGVFCPVLSHFWLFLTLFWPFFGCFWPRSPGWYPPLQPYFGSFLVDFGACFGLIRVSFDPLTFIFVDSYLVLTSFLRLKKLESNKTS